MSTLSLILALLSLMLIASETSALKCWLCSSDAINSEFCRKELNPSLLTPEQRRWRFVDCSPPKDERNAYGQKQVQKCRKQIHIIDGRKVYSRNCVIEAENVNRDDCRARPVLEGTKILACETCQEDGCNGDITCFSENSAEKTTVSIELLSLFLVLLCCCFEKIN